MAETIIGRNILTDSDFWIGSSYYNANLPLIPSPPEQNIIENRGLQKKPATYKYDAPDPVFFKTPTKSPKKTSVMQRLTSPVKTPVRSSPRKRLNMTPEHVSFHEESFAEITITPKRVKKEPFKNIKAGDNFERRLKALNHLQLTELISKTIEAAPNIKEMFMKFAPEPDLSPIVARLNVLLGIVHKSLPRNIWGSQDSSFTFLRVRSHLEAFKKECLDYCDQLLESQHWPTFFEYVSIAWKFTLMLPEWSAVAHNRVRNVCMQQISNKCNHALHEAHLDRMALAELVSRMKPFAEDVTVKSCINAATSLMENLSS